MLGVNQTARTATTPDEDGGDHIGYETPRSGVATPQPDLQDKRLPGIMSYFGQVRPEDSLAPVEASSSSESSVLRQPVQAAAVETPREAPLRWRSVSSADLQSQTPTEGVPFRRRSPTDLPASAITREISARRSNTAPKRQSTSHPYPTPPASHPSSSGGSIERERQTADCSGVTGSVSGAPAAMPRTSSCTDFAPAATEKSSQEVVRSSQPSAPQGASRSSPPSTSIPPPDFADQRPSHSSKRWYTLDGLKELTRGVIFKSGQSTPTRALSTARPSQAEGKGSSLSVSSSNEGAERSGAQTPRGPSSTGAQAPTPKGKLTIKIAEARGLRKSRDPYVVVVFQRSELISGGPRLSEEDTENLSVKPVGMGGVPIQRQGSDSGRPPMSIPMRSRQSSNTSTTEHNNFRNRSARTSFTNPKWDAEAVL
jgi:protein-serine/threonine kinase